MNTKRPVNPLIGLQAAYLLRISVVKMKNYLLPFNHLHDFVQIQGFGLLLDFGLVLWL